MIFTSSCLAQEEKVKIYNMQHMKQEKLSKLGERLRGVVTYAPLVKVFVTEIKLKTAVLS